MNEEEAKTKWCPFARPGTWVHGKTMSDPMSYVLGGNRDGNGRQDEIANCLGSACMAWRWLDADTDSPNCRGHCGLAAR